MIKRIINSQILQEVESGKVIVLMGARQVGKTTLIKKILDEMGLPFVTVDGDNRRYHAPFSEVNLERLKEIIGDYKTIFIDEAQSLPDIGLNLKLIHDHLPDVRVFVSGSSSFDIASKVSEPLTGRSTTFHLYPISLEELAADLTPFEIKQKVTHWMTYGLYPEILSTDNLSKKRKRLEELTNAYLYKDVIQLANIKKSDKIHKLIKLIALQIGSLVSTHELGKQLSLDSETVSNYIDILEKAFVIKRLSGFSKNPRKEISKMDKIYFLDLGVRNAMINDFRDIDSRQDVGALWENFLIMERQKYLDYHQLYRESFFWRKYSGAEVDYVETYDNQIDGYEIKWGKKKSRSGQSFLADYPEARFEVVDREGFLEWVR